MEHRNCIRHFSWVLCISNGVFSYLQTALNLFFMNSKIKYFHTNFLRRDSYIKTQAIISLICFPEPYSQEYHNSVGRVYTPEEMGMGRSSTWTLWSDSCDSHKHKAQSQHQGLRPCCCSYLQNSVKKDTAQKSSSGPIERQLLTICAMKTTTYHLGTWMSPLRFMVGRKGPVK